VERRREGGEIRKLQLNGKFRCEALIVAPCDELTQGQIRYLFAIFIMATNPPCKRLTVVTYSCMIFPSQASFVSRSRAMNGIVLVHSVPLNRGRLAK
jgi:hypothetical protein